MTAPLWKSASFQMSSQSSDSKNAPLVVVPWSKFGSRRLYVDTADGQHVGWVDLETGHRSLAMPDLAPAFERALAEGQAATLNASPAHTVTCAREFALIAGQGGETPSEPPTLMRHAYRGKSAYSSWDVGARGKRLAEEPVELVSLDSHLAYLNSAYAGDRGLVDAASGTRF